MYRIYPGTTGFSSSAQVPLTIAPKDGTPLAATAFQDSEGSQLDLYYLDASDNIVEAYLFCNTGSTTLTLRKNGYVWSGSGVHPSSSLAALYLDSSYGWRLYYQDSNGVLAELVGDNGWSTGTPSTNAKPRVGSPIAASLLPGPNINVFYVDTGNADLYYLQWVGSWSSPTLLTTALVSSWDGTVVSLAATAQTQSTDLRTYFISSDREVWEFGLNSNLQWNSQPAQSPVWAKSDLAAGGIAAVGWADQVRFYYIVDGTVVQADLGGTSWSEMVI